MISKTVPASGWLLCLAILFLSYAVDAQQPDTARINRLNLEARQAFHSGQFERNVVLTDSLAAAFAEAGDLVRYAMFSVFNGWTHLNELEDYERAAFYANRALQTIKEDLDEKAPFLSDVYGLLAGIYTKMGNPEKALDYNHLALETAIALGKTNSHGDYVANSNLGSAYTDLQRWPEALPYFERARTVLLYLAEKEGWTQRLCINASDLQANIANTYLGMGDPQRALEEALAGLVYTQKEVRPDHFGFEEIYRVLARTHSINEQPQAAEHYFQLLEKIYVDNFGRGSTQMAWLYEDKAGHAMRRNEWEKALRFNSEAAKILGLQPAIDQLHLIRNADESRCLSCEPDLYRQRTGILAGLARQSTEDQPKYLEACLATATLSMESLQEIRKTLLFREGSKRALFEKFQAVLHRGSQAAQALYERTGDPQYLEKAFHLAEQSKANILLEALVVTRAEAFSGLPADLSDREHQLSIELVRQERLLEDARIDRDTGRIGKIQNGSLFDAKERYESFLKQLEKDYPRYFAARHQVSTVSLPELQQVLDPQDLMVCYLLNEEDESLQIFAIARDQVILKNIPWTGQNTRQVQQLYRSLQQTSLIQTSKRISFIKDGYELYQLLLGPVESLLSTHSRLIIAADDVLHYLPFEVLLPREEDLPFSELNFLIRQVAVSYQYSGTVFRESTRRRGPDNNTLLAFAPVFQDGATAGELMGADRSLLEAELTAIRDGRFSPLPWSEKEVEAVSGLFEPGSFSVLVREKATESALKEAMENGSQYLHLASHSFTNRRNPHFSGIACAREDGEGAGEDGILYIGEIYRQPIHADLVILSSCESGVGNLAAGEGMLGLNRSFIYAGVPNVLYSLWRVDDQRTSELMVAFYRALKAGEPYYEALRRAKLQLLEDPDTALPRYWSAFTLIGR